MGYRISFCLMSNKPEMMLKFASSFAHGMCGDNEYELCLSHEGFSMEVLHRINMLLPPGVGYIVGHRPPTTGEFNYARGRMLSLPLCRRPDYIVIVDDDLEMEPGSGESYQRSFDFLNQGDGCGMVYHKGKVAAMGESIIALWQGFPETGYGMVVRGQRSYRDLIGQEYLWQGGFGSDYAIGVRCLEHALYLGEAYGTPGKKQSQRGSANWREPGTPLNTGIFREIGKRYGQVTMGGRIPEGLVKKYLYEVNK